MWFIYVKSNCHQQTSTPLSANGGHWGESLLFLLFLLSLLLLSLLSFFIRSFWLLILFEVVAAVQSAVVYKSKQISNTVCKQGTIFT